MREIFTEIFENQPLDPTEAARQTVRPRLRKRFYTQANAGDVQDGAGISLDGRPVLTPRRRAFVAPTQALAAAIAAEWNAQTEFIDPRQMPLTRLANAVIDAVVESPQPVADEIAKYLGSDLLIYRAEAPRSSSTSNRGPGIRCFPGRARPSMRASCWRKASYTWRNHPKPLRLCKKSFRASPGGLRRFHRSPR